MLLNRFATSSEKSQRCDCGRRGERIVTVQGRRSEGFAYQTLGAS